MNGFNLFELLLFIFLLIGIVAIFLIAWWLIKLYYQQEEILDNLNKKLDRFITRFVNETLTSRQITNNAKEELKKEIINLKIEENFKVISNRIYQIDRWVESINRSFHHKLNASIQPVYSCLQEFQKSLEDIKQELVQLHRPTESIPDELISPTSDRAVVKPETVSVEPPLTEQEIRLIEFFNSILPDQQQEQGFRQCYQPQSASCDREGIIYSITSLDDEDLWMIPVSDKTRAILLPSRRVLTKSLSTMLNNYGEGANRLIGSCFEIIMRDGLEYAHLQRFAEIDNIEQAASGAIPKARVKKKGVLELPSGKR